MRESVASAGSATHLKMGKTFALLEHIVGEGACNARADLSYVLWGRHGESLVKESCTNIPR
jgi:hypothetical protein